MRSLVVVGDSLLDRDVDGEVRRLTPDAPAPVLDEESSVDRPGGAALAALLAVGHGYEVNLVTALADDEGGARLGELLAAAGITVHPLPAPGPTPEKIRMRGSGQVLLRLDRGGDGPGSPGPLRPHEAALDVICAAAVVLASDYGRGLLREEHLRDALSGGPAPVVWDPHQRGPAAVPNARLVTPNETELRALVGLDPGGPRLPVATQGAARLRDRWRAGAVAVTMGRDGALLCHAGPTPLVVPAPVRAQGDSCGAGDQFAAAAATALADGALVSEAVQAAVAESAAYVSSGGPATVRADQPGTVRTHPPVSVAAPPPPMPHLPPQSPHHGRDRAGALVAQVRARGGTVVATGGCFDLLHAGHVATLQAARRLGDCLVVCLNSDASVAALKGPDRPLVNQSDRARLLAALGCVDAVVVFDEPTPHAVLSWLRPDVWVKGGDYADGGVPSSMGGVMGSGTALPEAELVRRWGGQTVVVPYLAGRSTSRLVAAARLRRKGE
jgi:rfaE bifunctional protein nucleotidyltransferase chain/domain/rfaE bifunctional protein kinase chain/domain